MPQKAKFGVPRNLKKKAVSTPRRATADKTISTTGKRVMRNASAGTRSTVHVIRKASNRAGATYDPFLRLCFTFFNFLCLISRSSAASRRSTALGIREAVDGLLIKHKKLK